MVQRKNRRDLSGSYYYYVLQACNLINYHLALCVSFGMYSILLLEKKTENIKTQFSDKIDDRDERLKNSLFF